MNAFQKLQKHFDEIPGLLDAVQKELVKNFEQLHTTIEGGKFALTELFVEGDSFNFYERYHDDKNGNFELIQDMAGHSIEIGKFAGQSIRVSFDWYLVNGCYVCFYEPTSIVVHWRMVEQWLELQSKAPRTNLINFRLPEKYKKWASIQEIDRALQTL